MTSADVLAFREHVDVVLVDVDVDVVVVVVYVEVVLGGAAARCRALPRRPLVVAGRRCAAAGRR